MEERGGDGNGGFSVLANGLVNNVPARPGIVDFNWSEIERVKVSTPSKEFICESRPS